MELIALDAEFRPYKYLNFIELQWNRKYYEPGEFSVQLRAAEYDAGMKYLFLAERSELGLIQKLEYKESISGQFVQLSGFFAEKLLDEKISYPTYQTSSSSVGDFMANVWNEFIAGSDLADEYHMMLSRARDTEINARTERFGKMTTGDAIGSMLYQTLQPQKVSYEASYDIEEAGLVYTLRMGKDLTQDNLDGNNFVVFSEGFGNLVEAVVTEDCSNHKNYAIVQGEGEGASRITVTVDQSGEDVKRVLYVDAKDLRQEDGVTLEEYKDQLRQRGLEKLEEHVNISNVETSVTSNNGFRYMEDYNLGDTVDIVVSTISKAYTAQIIEVDEVIKGTNHEINITFGDEIPSVWKKARIQ